MRMPHRSTTATSPSRSLARTARSASASRSRLVRSKESTMDIRTLGYVRFGVTDLDGWISFFRDMVGAMVEVDESTGVAHVRVDEYESRIRLVSHDTTELLAA